MMAQRHTVPGVMGIMCAGKDLVWSPKIQKVAEGIFSRDFSRVFLFVDPILRLVNMIRGKPLVFYVVKEVRIRSETLILVVASLILCLISRFCGLTYRLSVVA